MKLFHVWIVLGIAGIIASIVFFTTHKSLLVLLMSLAMCSLTIAGVIRTTDNDKDQANFLRPVISSFLGCIIIGGYINVLAFSSGGWGNFLSITFYTGIFCIPVLALDKGAQETLGGLFGPGFRQVFSFSPDPNGCFINIIAGIFAIALSVCLGVLLMIISYILSTAMLLLEDVNSDVKLSSVLKSLNVSLFKKRTDPSNTSSSTSSSESEKDDGEWL